MSNKTQLQANNLMLNTFINRINAVKDIAASLPEAGADVEFWDGSFSGEISVLDGYKITFDLDVTKKRETNNLSFTLLIFYNFKINNYNTRPKHLFNTLKVINIVYRKI